MSQPIGNILIVEDEILIAQRLNKVITDHGYHCVGIAISYEKAVALLETEKVDLVLIDINLSGTKSGIDVANTINELFQLPFLFLTSYTDQATLEAVKACKPNGYLSKPVNKATLLTTLDILLEKGEEDQAKSFQLEIGNSTYTIDFSKLLFVKSTHVYVELHFLDETMLLRISLKELLTRIPEDALIRINRSIAVNPTKIFKRKGTLVYIENHVFKVSKNYIASF